MKKHLFVLLLLSVGASLFAQNNETVPGDSIPWEFRKQAFIYNTARLFNDPIITRMALYNLLAENPGNVALYDSLALSYIQFNQNASAALVAQQALRIDPNDMLAVEIAATSLDNIGAKDKAIIQFEKLYLSNGDINVLYKVAFLQFELKRFTEASTSLDIIIDDPQSKNNIIAFPTVEGIDQEVPLDVSAKRVKAMVALDQGNEEEAKTIFLEVLELYPGFQVVQQQLRTLTSKDDQD